MRNLIERFLREEDGMEFVEWAIVATLFALAAAFIWDDIATAITDRLGDVESCISTGDCGEGA